MRWWIRGVIVVLLGLVLTGCGGGIPNQGVIERAIVLQFRNTQAELSPQLFWKDAPVVNVNVRRVKVGQQETLVIQNVKTYHLRGTYDAVVEWRDRKTIQQQSPFEVYLQHQRDSQDWQLIRPASAGAAFDSWITQSIPFSD